MVDFRVGLVELKAGFVLTWMVSGPEMCFHSVAIFKVVSEPSRVVMSLP